MPFLLAGVLTACSSLGPSTGTQAIPGYQQNLLDLQQWTLRGRLNVRDQQRSDTINISWEQVSGTYDINLSGTLGMGAVHIQGSETGVMVERGREAPVFAESLSALGNEILGYAFPTSELLYWIRALPAPGTAPEVTLNGQGLPAILSQTDAAGRRWEMQYDRYSSVDNYILPGRIRLEQSPYRLTFLISDWQDLSVELP